VFGFSIFEVLMIGVVALVAVGPQRLPGMLKTFGAWMRKLRKMTTDVRAQTGIDELLKQEGIHGGLNELRSLVRGHGPPAPAPAPIPYRREDPYASLEIDVTREYPPEGPDAYGTLPDDLLLPPPPAKAPEKPAPLPSASDTSAPIPPAAAPTEPSPAPATTEAKLPS
jgi:sec-independent protein translocase protein TatB